jgi:hypothetical protein
LRILFDKNVPVGVRGFLPIHEVHTFVELQWPDQLEKGRIFDHGRTSRVRRDGSGDGPLEADSVLS